MGRPQLAGGTLIHLGQVVKLAVGDAKPAQQNGSEVTAQLGQQVVASRLAAFSCGRQLSLKALPLGAPAILQAVG
jgi:hypothetical protein